MSTPVQCGSTWYSEFFTWMYMLACEFIFVTVCIYVTGNPTHRVGVRALPIPPHYTIACGRQTHPKSAQGTRTAASSLTELGHTTSLTKTAALPVPALPVSNRQTFFSKLRENSLPSFLCFCRQHQAVSRDLLSVLVTLTPIRCSYFVVMVSCSEQQCNINSFIVHVNKMNNFTI